MKTAVTIAFYCYCRFSYYKRVILFDIKHIIKHIIKKTVSAYIFISGELNYMNPIGWIFLRNKRHPFFLFNHDYLAR